MIDRSQFSPKLLSLAEAGNEQVLERIVLAKRRIQSVLDRDLVCNQKTLEQKISEQGPKPMRVDPHLIGKAILDLTELNRLTRHAHVLTKGIAWFANPGTSANLVNNRLEVLAPLYDRIIGHGFGNLSGDALELIVWKCLRAIHQADKRYPYMGHFDLSQPKDAHGRYRKSQPPKTLGERSTIKEADFFQFGHAAGTLCIECKNLREWMYPDHPLIKELIIKASELGAIPVLIARRVHYTTRINLLEPAGIIAHESLFQYYPAHEVELARQVSDARSLGFTDVVATEEPHARTVKFFTRSLPAVVDYMAERWFQNEDALVAYAHNEINLAQLYTAIGSVAGGKWRERGRD
jgi:hypothetical protein